eukprot:GSChrysophyteH1.ASY1.ANO1.1684.1 assembled CDS
MQDSHAADVQAELQQYLNSKNINSLFISIVESLLIEKPANPIAFIIEYLYKQYPDQAKAALDSLAGGNATAPTAAAPAAQASAAAGGAADDDSEEDDEDDMGDIVEIAPKARPAGRRTSVSAESMDPSKMKAQMANVTCIEKDPAVYNKLMETVGKSALLKMLDAEQKDKIVKAFSGPLMKPPGEDVITQGDIGDVFYLLEEGEVDVYIKKKGEEGEIKVHTYKPGDAFGELAIMYNAPRAATCRCSTDCKLWALDRTSFKVIVVAATMIKRETYQGFLQKVPILSSLNEGEVMTLADSLAEEKYPAGSTVCTQGEEGNYFYIIKEGKAVCSVTDATEIALMTAKPRQATVKAAEDLSVLALDRATFTRVLGNLEDIMKRNIDQYTKYTAGTI